MDISCDFNPLPSCEGRLSDHDTTIPAQKISIHSPRARGDDASGQAWYDTVISIHSPHARGDFQRHKGNALLRISIHSPHARGDDPAGSQWYDPVISIHSPHARGDHAWAERRADNRISIHSPHARRDDHLRPSDLLVVISIHSPRVRGDFCANKKIARSSISIHSPRARGDTKRPCRRDGMHDFNPLPSCEGRLRVRCQQSARLPFQSTPLMRGETSRANTSTARL